MVGAGNAALCAALAAAQAGASVMVLERAPLAESGGNSRFTAGAFRCVYDGVDDLRALMPDLTDAEVASADFGTYTEAQFFDDMGRITEYRTDPELCELLVTRSRPTMQWMQGKGVRFMPIWGRQAYRIEGRFKFWGGLTVEAWGGGPGLMDGLYRSAAAAGVEIAFGASVRELIADDDGVRGVRVRQDGRTREVRAKAVVLACGGFEANAEWRTRYLGPGWDLAKVRGTRFNTGEGIRMALAIGAASAGNWSGCHAVGWDRNAPDFGDLAVGDGFQKHSYPLGVLINARGERFVDEGADFPQLTYAKCTAAPSWPSPASSPGRCSTPRSRARCCATNTGSSRRRGFLRAGTRWRRSAPSSRMSTRRPGAGRACRRSNAAVMTDVAFDPNVKELAAARSASRSRSPTGPTRSGTLHRSRPTRSPAASSPSPSAA